jgi:digalactosyldiacylglycerol synthase
MSTFGKPREISARDDQQRLPVEKDPLELQTSSEEAEFAKVQEIPMDIELNLNGTVALVPARTKLPVPRPAKPGEPILPQTDVSDKSKRIWIVTTAALPWMTGTAVNPLLRAAYLLKGRKEADGKVTLMLPWLEVPADQERIYGKDRAFEKQADQEKYIRTWLRDSAGMKEASENLNIAWYPARVEPAENSVYGMGDITSLIPAEEVDVCVLEEPEHLNWYRYESLFCSL